MNLRNKKILITGGSGFIGSNLIKKLECLGAQVTVFDKSNGYDIQNEHQLISMVKKKFDAIYHLAAFSGPTQSNLEKIKSFEINTLSTINLCQLIAKQSSGTKLIISSSRLEYGIPQYLPVDEKHPTKPTSVYGLSKLTATQFAQMCYLKYNLDVCVFRTSNVYGPHNKQKFSGYNIINHFIDLALQNQTLKIYGNGNQRRDYIYVEDLVDVFISALVPKSSGQIYNLGYGRGIEFKEMVKLIIKKTGKGRIAYEKWPDNFESVETGSYISDIGKVKKELGFKPLVNFKTGIDKTLEQSL